MPDYVLGIDFGSKRIGLSIGQTLTQSAQPLDTLANNKQVFDNLIEIIKEWQVKQLVLGLPLDMDGQEQEITRQVKNFAKKLTRYTRLPVDFMDERLSSFEAERRFQQLRQNKLIKAKNKSQIDALAAQIILQSWFDQMEYT